MEEKVVCNALIPCQPREVTEQFWFGKVTCMAKKSTKKNILQKPKNVPEDAVWNGKEEEWELGETKKGKPVGSWVWWRADGTLVCRSNFNQYGQLHGEFARFHPDGSVSRKGKYLHGKQAEKETHTRSEHETEENFPADDPRIWRVEIDHGKQGHDSYQDSMAMRYFLRDGSETNAKGVPLPTAYQDELFVNTTPADFLEQGGFERYLAASNGFRKSSELPSGFVDFEKMWGMSMPGDLAQCVTLLTRAKKPAMYEWEFDVKGSFLQLPETEEENTVEKWIKAFQKTYWIHPSDLFGGSLNLGFLGNGDFYQYGLYDVRIDPKLARNQIWLYDHEEHGFSEGPIAQDLSTLAYVGALCAAYEDEQMVSLAGFKKSFQKLKGRTGLSWHFSGMKEKARVKHAKSFDYQSQTEPTRFLFLRALWIQTLLQNEDRMEMADVKDVFFPSLNEAIPAGKQEQILNKVGRNVPTAMYWLFRCFFFKENEMLEACIAEAKQSAARLIRDAGCLVEMLQKGHKKLGTIKDIHALRKKFMALDLDPNRAEARKKENEIKNKEAKVAKKEHRVLVETWIKQGRDLEELAWQYLEQPDVHNEIVKHWRTLPEMQRTFDLLDWIDAQKYVRDNLILKNELQEACFCLAEMGDKRMLPVLVGKLYQDTKEGNHATEILRRWLGEKVGAAVMPLLDREDKYHIIKTRAVQILGALSYRKALPKITEFLKKYPLHGDFMNSVYHEDVVVAVLHALCHMPDASLAENVAKFMLHPDAHYDKWRGKAAKILAKMGATSFLPDLIRLQSEHPTPDMLWAIGELGSKAEWTQKNSAVALLQTWVHSPDATMMAVAQAGLEKCGAMASDLIQAVEKILKKVGYDQEKTRGYRVWGLRLVGESATIPTSLCIPHVYTDEHVVRQAALAALKMRGVAVPPVHAYAHFDVEDLYHKEGLPGLHKALLDPQGIFSYQVARKLAELGNPLSAGPLCQQIRAHVQSWDAQTSEGEGPYAFDWLVKSLIRLGPLQEESAAVLLACLQHSNRYVKDPVLREPPQDERLLPGMLQVVEENYGWQAKTAQAWLKTYKNASVHSQSTGKKPKRRMDS